MYKIMRIILYLFICTVLLSSSCAENKRLRKSNKSTTENIIPEIEEKQVIEPASLIKEFEEKLVVNDEKPPDPHMFFVIIGSFRNPDNAKRYQLQIAKDNFGSEVLKNEAGLFRVSVMATDEINVARDEIKRIRKLFPKYFDTWLLIQKK
jgi:hypothetical protein